MWAAVKEYFSEFKVLKHTPREFWILNLVINFFEMVAYFSFITVLTLYLTDNVGMSDQWAGNIIGIFTLLITLTIFISGFIIDSIGVRRALFISMVILVFCRLGIGLVGPFENWYLEKNINLNSARTQIETLKYNETAFTKDKAKLKQAQIDIVTSDPSFKAKGIDTQKLSDDAQVLRENLLATAKTSSAVQKQWGADIEEKMKDQTEFTKIVAALVAEKPDMVEKYFVDFKKVENDPVQLKSSIVSIVKAYPELRAQFSIQDLLKIIVIVILVFTAFAEALMVPGIYAALRKYTNKKTSGTGFNFQYLTMNVGAVASFASFDYLRNHFGNGSIILVGSFFAILCAIGTLFLREHVEVQEDGSVVAEKQKKEEKTEMPWTIAYSVIREKAFWRFILFMVILVGVKLTFTHQFLVMPKYYDRVLGPYAAVGALNTINPIIITIGLILFIPIVARFRVFSLIVLGTFISASSVFALAIPGKWLTVFGWSIEQGYLFLVLAQIVIFALGELIWSPRLQEYTVVIAPRGREGSYMALSALPMFIAKPLNGWLSGLLLTKYCPATIMDDIVSGARTYFQSPEMMWVVLGTLALSSPLLVLALKKVIKPDASREAEKVSEEIPAEAAGAEA